MEVSEGEMYVRDRQVRLMFEGHEYTASYLEDYDFRRQAAEGEVHPDDRAAAAGAQDAGGGGAVRSWNLAAKS